ncbi:MAG: SDR family NAD(P)-dependent oxidoreductase [Clostridia bacterium]
MEGIGRQKALVTGSTQGIGRALALALASCGARVTVHGASSREKAMAVAEEITAAGERPPAP